MKMTSKTLNNSLIASFGRRRGRSISSNRSELLDSLLPSLLINLEDVGHKSYSQNQLVIEIGFGSGDHLAAQALANPHLQFIGCEPYLNGVTNLLQLIKQHQLTNISIFTDDARLLLKALPDHQVSQIYILFPDPWPKAKHHKRRIISIETINLLAKKLSLTGKIIVASDHADYNAWIKDQFAASADFALHEIPLPAIKTKYQLKAEKLGIISHYYCTLRKDFS